MVLMPIFEADFHPRSFGFRPGRNAHQAVEAIREGLRMGKTEVVDADLAQYFDTIPHQQLMRQVAPRQNFSVMPAESPRMRPGFAGEYRLPGDCTHWPASRS